MSDLERAHQMIGRLALQLEALAQQNAALRAQLKEQENKPDADSR